jgi:autoinducer 2-degrading protein
MIVTCVYVHVKEEKIGDFIEVTTRNHLASVHEPGNLRFDVIQSVDNPGEFLLYEAYDSEEEAAAHKETAQYLEWKEAVAPWMAEPRKGVKYNAICP